MNFKYLSLIIVIVKDLFTHKACQTKVERFINNSFNLRAIEEPKCFEFFICNRTYLKI